MPYPPTDAKDPDGVDRSYDDRTSFWALKYRGELRKQVLQYARDRGLVHPEDTGTITHWHLHTPSSFYRSRPDFPVIRDQRTGYSLATQAIWDIESQVTWDAYWKLTEAHIREFGPPRMFHTIGMAERTFGGDDRDNLQRKLYVYRKTQQQLREHYPDAPLLIASWDFIGWRWTDAGVNRLLAEFDPGKTILLDYTADCARKVTYRDWEVLGQFPWIFGIFHGFARNSDVHEDYRILTGSRSGVRRFENRPGGLRQSRPRLPARFPDRHAQRQGGRAGRSVPGEGRHDSCRGRRVRSRQGADRRSRRTDLQRI